MQTTATMPARAEPVVTSAQATPAAVSRLIARTDQPAPRQGANATPAASAALESAVARAAEQYYAGRDIEVHSSLDESTGRMVHKITDRATGDVIAQSPPEELLRFFASGRAELPRPWLQLEA
jgi:flagellar protein FlaG